MIVDAEGSSDLKLDAVVGEERVEAVRFNSGEEFAADLVIIATSPQPNTILARSAGLEVNRGIVVNDRMEASDPHIFAVGGCTEHEGQTFDYWPPLLEQAKALAANLTGRRRSGFTNLDAVFQELATSPLHHRAE
jgi:nitrite reductase (NADH) large subunit